MGIEMPAEVRWLLPIVVGDSWPEGDETALQRLAEVWKQAAADVDDALREAEDAVRQATSNMDGEAAEAFKKYWEKFVKGEEATVDRGRSRDSGLKEGEVLHLGHIRPEQISRVWTQECFYDEKGEMLMSRVVGEPVTNQRFRMPDFG